MYKRRKRMKETFAFCPYKVSPIGHEADAAPKLKVPKARSGHRIVISHDCNIYSFGGYSSEVSLAPDETTDFIWMQDCLLFKELWKFNLASETWCKLKTEGLMPEQLASHAIALYGDNLLVFGGTSLPFGDSSSNSVHMVNLKDLKWKKLETTGTPPLPQYGQAVVLKDHMLFVVGGTTGFDYSMDVHFLNLKTRTWAELKENSKPQSRYRHEINIENGKIYVFGGGTATCSFSLDKIPVFDIEEKTWSIQHTTADEYPAARRCHGCVRFGNSVYISGGQDGENIFSDIWTISLKTFKWVKLPQQLPVPVYFHSAAVSPEGQMCIFGGVTSIAENSRTNGLYSVWLQIPPLSEISFQALLHYVPDVTRLRKRELLAAGVPPNFVKRIDCIDSV